MLNQAVKKYGSGEYEWSWISLPLTEAANAYCAGQTLLAPTIMPFIATPFGSGLIPLVGRTDYVADDLSVAQATECGVYRFDLESKRYYIERRAIKSPLEMEIMKDGGDLYKWQEQVTTGLTGLLNASLEKKVWDLVNVATNVGSVYTVKSAFTGAGDAMAAVLGLLDGVQNASGTRPDFVSMGKDAAASFFANSSVLARGAWSPAKAAEVLRVNTVAVHDGTYNSADHGLTPIFTPFQTPDSISAFCTKGPRWGVRPYWNPPEVPGGPVYVEEYEEPKAWSRWIECGIWTKEVVADANLAGSLLGVNSSQAGGL